MSAAAPHTSIVVYNQQQFAVQLYCPLQALRIYPPLALLLEQQRRHQQLHAVPPAPLVAGAGHPGLPGAARQRSRSPRMNKNWTRFDNLPRYALLGLIMLLEPAKAPLLPHLRRAATQILVLILCTAIACEPRCSLPSKNWDELCARVLSRYTHRLRPNNRLARLALLVDGTIPYDFPGIVYWNRIGPVKLLGNEHGDFDRLSVCGEHGVIVGFLRPLYHLPVAGTHVLRNWAAKDAVVLCPSIGFRAPLTTSGVLGWLFGFVLKAGCA